MTGTLLEKHPKAVGIGSGALFVAGVGDIVANLHYVSNHMISMPNILLFAVGLGSSLLGGTGAALSIAELRDQAEERMRMQVVDEWNSMGEERSDFFGRRFRQLPPPVQPKQWIDNPPQFV